LLGLIAVDLPRFSGRLAVSESVVLDFIPPFEFNR
jgi:hypothetical protein